jgi:hypothetical protein
MSEIRKSLETIGLGQYADAVETNAIDVELLRQVDDTLAYPPQAIGCASGTRSVNWPLASHRGEFKRQRPYA